MVCRQAVAKINRRRSVCPPSAIGTSVGEPRPRSEPGFCSIILDAAACALVLWVRSCPGSHTCSDESPPPPRPPRDSHAHIRAQMRSDALSLMTPGVTLAVLFTSILALFRCCRTMPENGHVQHISVRPTSTSVATSATPCHARQKTAGCLPVCYVLLN